MKTDFHVDGSQAFMDVYETKESPKGAVIICPGGGYSFLSPREAEPVANAFVKEGYLAFVLYYELEHFPLGNRPLNELAQAVAYVRNHGAVYGLESEVTDPKISAERKQKKVFVTGFSAGAHLAASLGVLWNVTERFPAGTDLQKHRPDGMILNYPVISSGEFAHKGSFMQLAGENVEAHEMYSLEKYVSDSTVPAFLWHTAADIDVPVQNSLLFAVKLAKYRVPVEYHVFPYGVHGLSLATKEVEDIQKDRFADVHVARWFQLCIYWLDEIANR